jgi:folate-binding protein YgfZ
MAKRIMNRTPLYDVQHKAGAAFTRLWDWEVVDTFGNATAEYSAATESIAVLDRSYMGRFKVTGKDATDLLNRLSSNKVDVLPSGTGTATVLPTNKGRVIDLLHLFALEDLLLMITSPQTRQRVAEWIDLYTFLEEVSLEDVTLETAMITVLGPRSATVLEHATGASVTSMELYHSLSLTVNDVSVTMVRTDPTGTPGYDLIMPLEHAAVVWSALVDPAYGAVPIGETVYNVLRTEAGIPRYGWEISEDVNPWEVGLDRFINFEKGCYTGQEVILRLYNYSKIQRRFAGLSFSSPNVSEGAVLRLDGEDTGRITTVITHPVTGATLGLGIVRVANVKEGARLEVVNAQKETVGEAILHELQVMTPVGLSG